VNFYLFLHSTNYRPKFSRSIAWEPPLIPCNLETSGNWLSLLQL
jgi:hypothetical protein